MSVIASGHPETTRTGRLILDSGGNAVDAAIGAWMTACVVEPVLTSPAGGGFLLLSPATGAPELHDFFVQTPIQKNRDVQPDVLHADFGRTQQAFSLGWGSVAVPGCIHGLSKLHQSHGRIPFRELALPAIELARGGVKITAHAAHLFRVVSALYQATEESRRLFLSTNPGHKGKLLVEGDDFRNPDLASFFEVWTDEGPDLFYRGEIGARIAQRSRENGGHLQREDFERYQSILRDPLELQLTGGKLLTNPPPALGGFLVACGCLLLRSSNPDDPQCFRDIASILHFLSALKSGPEEIAKKHEALRDKLLQSSQYSEALKSAQTTLFPSEGTQTKGTTQISVIDDTGMAISMTTSNGAGSALIADKCGFMLNNMLGEDDLNPKGWNEWKTNTRLSSMMAPSILFRNDGSLIATGSGGSNRIRSTLAQVIHRLLHIPASLAEIIEAPRFHAENNNLHLESTLEPLLGPWAEEDFKHITTHDTPNLFFGGCHTVRRDPTGGWEGAGDSRRGGTSG